MELRQAITKGDFLLSRSLIESGCDPNAVDEERRTPLMLCCLHDGERRALGVARILLVHGARVGLRDGKGRNALAYAVLYERLGLTGLLLEALDYDLNQSDWGGRTALWYTANQGHATIVRLLLRAMTRYGLDVDKPDKEGVTPLMQACRLGHRQCAAELRATGRASDSLRDKTHGRTAKDWELWRGPRRREFREDLPYKTLPANLWAKRDRFYKDLGPDRVPKSKALPAASVQGSETDTPAPDSQGPGRDWRLDMRSLTEALQSQISPSYRSLASQLPPALLLRRRNPQRDGRRSPGLDALLQQRRRRGRKMSFDALSDALLRDSRPQKVFRRRCSVAVIPLVRLSVSQRSSAHGSESGAEDRPTPRPLGKSPLS